MFIHSFIPALLAKEYPSTTRAAAYYTCCTFVRLCERLLVRDSSKVIVQAWVNRLVGVAEDAAGC